MTTLVLFHSALGLRPAVHTFADRLRAAGHTVHTPDLFDGEVHDDLEAGVATRDRLGVPTLLGRAMAAVDHLADDVVYGGLSMGTAAAQMLALSRPGARGALLLHGALPLELFGASSWPDGVPVQLHLSPDDPWVDHAGVEAFVSAVPSGAFERFEHDGTAHLFTDVGHPDHDAAATDRTLAEASRFLARCGELSSATARPRPARNG